jgi:hypothetical protein
MIVLVLFMDSIRSAIRIPPLRKDFLLAFLHAGRMWMERPRAGAGRIRTLPPARGLQAASVSERAYTKRLTCELADDEAA